LIDIKEKYDRKKKHIPPKKTKNKATTGKSVRNANRINLEEIELKYGQKLILNELKNLAGLARKVRKRIARMEKKSNKFVQKIL